MGSEEFTGMCMCTLQYQYILYAVNILCMHLYIQTERALLTAYVQCMHDMTSNPNVHVLVAVAIEISLPYAVADITPFENNLSVHSQCSFH